MLREQLLVLGDDLVLLEPGEPVQAHVEDGLGLRSRTGGSLPPLDAELGGETVGPRRDGAGARQQLRHGARQSTSRAHQRDLRLRPATATP